MSELLPRSGPPHFANSSLKSAIHRPEQVQ
jgi:hypothetical protein